MRTFADMATTTLKEKTASGLLWGGISNGAQQFLNFAFGICLARILSVEDYGLVGMLTIFSLIAGSLQESGFISGLNRKASVTHEDYNAVFWFNVLCGLSAYALLFCSAPLIASYYGRPVLAPLSRLYFLNFLISSLGVAPRAYLFRNMKVKQTALVSVAALLVSGCAGVALALNGFAYWGIAVQNLVFCLMVTLLSWRFARWRPSLHVNFAPLRGMIGFSSKLLVTNVFTHINNNLFSVFFGKLYGATLVGYYNQANKWTSLGYTTLSGMLQGVIQPVFARLEDDRERETRIFRKMLRFTAFVSFPALLGLALIAPEFITVTITGKWLRAARLMQILCVGGAFMPVAQFYANFVISQGKSNLFMYSTIGLCLAQLLCLLLLYPYGVETMVAAYVAVNILWIPLWHRHVRRLLGLPLLRAVADVLPFALAALASMGAAWLASRPFSSPWAVLGIKVAVAAALYAGILRLAGAVVLTESLEYLKGRFKKK